MNTERNKFEVLKKFYANKKLFWSVIISVAVLLAVGVGVLIAVLTDETYGDTPNTGETLSDTYSLGMSADVFSASSKWEFSDDNTVVNTYNDGEETVTVSYRYIIAIENGQKVIKLTHTPEGGEPITTTHSFVSDIVLTKDGVKYKQIMINGATYTCPTPIE